MDNGDLVLAKLDTARFALSEAKTIQETKKILDVASAAEILAKRQKMGEEAISYATSIKVEALAQLGRMLKEMPKNEGGYAGKYAGTELVPAYDIPTLSDMGLDKKTSKLAQDIASLPDDKLEAVKKGTVAISRALQKAHVSYSNEEEEWYTPKVFIDKARLVMGSIDLDPASCEEANKVVGANKYYTREDNGLNQQWYGNIWLNPPYSYPGIVDFTNKIIGDRDNYNQLCLLVNNGTETRWLQQLLAVCDNVCFPKGRIRFWSSRGETMTAPLQGQALLYFGENSNKFNELFSDVGVVLWRNI